MICKSCREVNHQECMNNGKDYPSCACQHRVLPPAEDSKLGESNEG